MGSPPEVLADCGAGACLFDRLASPALETPQRLAPGDLVPSKRKVEPGNSGSTLPFASGPVSTLAGVLSFSPAFVKLGVSHVCNDFVKNSPPSRCGKGAGGLGQSLANPLHPRRVKADQPVLLQI